LGADHRGFALKTSVKSNLRNVGYDVEDLGAYTFHPEDDYVIYAEKVASSVAGNKGSRGVLFCGSGVGMDIAANKFSGIRASIGKSVEQVRAGRRDDDMNVLVIAAEFTDEAEALEMIKAFLEADFDGKPRHKRRIEMIEDIEDRRDQGLSS
jgi:ribose 5-phosphate isomerase B